MRTARIRWIIGSELKHTYNEECYPTEPTEPTYTYAGIHIVILSRWIYIIDIDTYIETRTHDTYVGCAIDRPIRLRVTVTGSDIESGDKAGNTVARKI